MPGPETRPHFEQETRNVPHVVMWRVLRPMSHERRQQTEVKPGEWFRVVAIEENDQGLPTLDSVTDTLLRERLAEQWNDVASDSLQIRVPVAHADGTNCREETLKLSRGTFEVPGYYSLRSGSLQVDDRPEVTPQEVRRSRAVNYFASLLKKWRDR